SGQFLLREIIKALTMNTRVDFIYSQVFSQPVRAMLKTRHRRDAGIDLATFFTASPCRAYLSVPSEIRFAWYSHVFFKPIEPRKAHGFGQIQPLIGRQGSQIAVAIAQAILGDGMQ